MSEALCGPSNALQNFQKHTSVDRTLQQDRTVSGRRQEQGFRSTGPASGALDAEFHAFQAPQLPSIPLQRAQLPLAHVTRYATPPLQVAPDWAADFQNLNMSDSRTVVNVQQRSSAPRTAQGGWHTEFMGQTNAQGSIQTHQPGLNQWQSQYQGFNPYMNDTMYAPSMQQMQPEQIMHAEPQFDDSAFAQAFDQAKAEMDKSSEGKGKEKAPEEFNMSHACTDPGDVLGEFDFDQMGLTQGTLNPAEASDPQSLNEPMNGDLQQQEPDLPRIGADTIIANPQSEAINPQVEADELSRTAGHLLDTLKDEKNAKFQQSSFLALMRQLRDKEVKVDGDKMVPVTSNPVQSGQHPGGRYYPYDAFSRAPLNASANSVGDANDGPPIQHFYADP